MPLFRFNVTRAGETRTTDLRKSNPQGWLIEAVKATYPEIASRRIDTIIRLKLQKPDPKREVWQAILADAPHDLEIEVVKIKA